MLSALVAEANRIESGVKADVVAGQIELAHKGELLLCDLCCVGPGLAGAIDTVALEVLFVGNRVHKVLRLPAPVDHRLLAFDYDVHAGHRRRLGHDVAVQNAVVVAVFTGIEEVIAVGVLTVEGLLRPIGVHMQLSPHAG